MSGGIALLFGTLGVLGWALPLPRLAAVLADGASMKLDSALALVLLGLALLVPRARSPLALLVALLAVAFLGESLLGRDLGLDQALVRDALTPAAEGPGRPSASTALALLLVGGSLLAGRRARALASWLAVAAFLLSADAVVIHVDAFGRSRADTGMALQTGIALLALATGALALAPGAAPLAAFASPRLGGRLTRRRLPPLVLAIVALGTVAARGAGAADGHAALWIAAQTIATCTGLVVAAWWYAVDLNREDARREQAQRALEAANAELERRIADRTRELALAHGEMEAFVHAIGHDIRAPIRVLAGNAAMVLQDCHEGLPEEDVRLLERMVVRATGLGTLVDDLLRYVRVAGATPEVRPLDLTALARNVAQEVEGAATARVVVEEGLTAIADPSLLRLILLNLIGNACKFSPRGGEVVVGRAGEAAFFVRDDGVGFDMAHAETIFEPLKRLVRESEFAGSGMGLANVRRAVQRHGGRVWAESEPERGATFLFTLGG